LELMEKHVPQGSDHSEPKKQRKRQLSNRKVSRIVKEGDTSENEELGTRSFTRYGRACAASLGTGHRLDFTRAGIYDGNAVSRRGRDSAIAASG
jgi:hypothetical protein